MQTHKGKGHYFLSNLFYAFLAQGISLLLSVLMSLVVPKILGVREFGYWQLFLFYTSFVGFFHFGLNDGIYLRYGGIPYNKLDYPLLGSQFWFSIIAQSFIAVMGVMYAFFGVSEPDRIFVLVAAAIFLLLNNSSGYLWFVFQLSNQTKIYSLSVIINKIFFMIAVLFLLICKEKNFRVFVIFYGVAQLLSLLYCMWVGRKLVFAKFISLNKIIKEVWINIKIGINLMFSNIADMLVIGSGRFVIDSVWGITVFGKFSFALSLTMFFMLFISQVSIVLFPTLRQTNKDNLKTYFILGRDTLGYMLTGIFLMYLPIKYILEFWLPQYHDSLEYMALLLPLCTYDGKMQMLCCTYLKVLRKEKILLLANVLTLLGSAIFAVVGGYLFHNVYFIIISMVVFIALRSISTEFYLSKSMGFSAYKSIITESILALIFVLCTVFLHPLLAFGCYLVVYIIYLYVSKKRLLEIVGLTKSMLGHKKPSNINMSVK